VIKEIPTYVDANAVANCTITNGFVRVLNGAASGVELPLIPPGSSEFNDASAGIGLDTVAKSVVVNYSIAQSNAEQLNALQAWLRNVGSAK
jgi:hypothetical protein